MTPSALNRAGPRLALALCLLLPAAFPTHAAPNAGASITGNKSRRPEKPLTSVNPIDGAEMVRAPAGRFRRGSKSGFFDERPSRKIKFKKALWVYKTPVTNEQYARFLAASPKFGPPPSWSEPRFTRAQQPVVGVTWHEAAAYCEWAGMRLPTEAEWEYVARGPASSTYPWGEDPPDATRADFGQSHKTGRPRPVGERPAGASWCGALDMAGSVWEWCGDWYDEVTYKKSRSRDPQGIPRDIGYGKCLRGGEWGGILANLRSSIRSCARMETRFNAVGFRCVRN